MRYTGLFLGAVLCSLLNGCGTKHQELVAERPSATPGTSKRSPHTNESNEYSIPAAEQSGHGVTFKEGEGLTVPQITSEMLGLKIVEVSEGKATGRIDLPLRVFKADGSGTNSILLASGPVETNLLSFLQPGTRVQFDRSSFGSIVRVEPSSARLTGLAEVVVQLPASNNVQLGTFLDGTVPFQTKNDVVLIPKQALLKAAEGDFAYVVNGKSLFRTKISVGAQEGDAVEVTEGLYAGDRVVVQPIMSLWLAELQAIRGGKACADGH